MKHQQCVYKLVLYLVANLESYKQHDVLRNRETVSKTDQNCLSSNVFFKIILSQLFFLFFFALDMPCKQTAGMKTNNVCHFKSIPDCITHMVICNALWD